MVGPTLRKRELGTVLRRLRKEVGITQEQAAVHIGCSVTKIGHIENGRNSPRKTELLVLLQLYNAEDAVDNLEGLRKEAERRGWWSTARLPEWLATYVGLESDATSIRLVECELIPGLLQTKNYARYVHSRGTITPPEEIERRVSARVKRQQRLSEPDAPQLSVVLSEAALCRCSYQSKIAEEQFSYLHNMAQRENIDLRILPFSSGLHGSMEGSFALLSFPANLLPDTVYLEYPVGGHVVDDESIVGQLVNLYAELRDQTLTSDESLSLIAEYIQQSKRN